MRKLRWLLVAGLVGACSDGGTGPSDEPGSFTADRSAYQVHQVAVLTLTGPAPAAGMAIEGMLGATPVTLARSSDSTVVLLAPSVTGTHTLEFAAAGREYSGAITVVAAQPVANPMEYLQSVVSDASVRIDAAEQQILAEGTAEQNALALELLQVARDSLVRFEASLEQLTPDDAQAAANALSVNLTAMQSSAQRYAAAGIAHAVVQGPIPAECAEKTTALHQYQCTWGRFIDSMAGVTVGFGGAAVSLMGFGAWGIPFAAGLAVYGSIELAKALDLGWELLTIHGMYAAELGRSLGQAAWDAAGAPVWEAGTEFFRTHVYDPNAFAFAGAMMPPASMTSFTDGGMVSFGFAPQLRRVRAADRAIGVTWLNRALAQLQSYNEAAARFGTKFQLPFAPPASSYAADVPYNQISIEVVENAQVRVRSLAGSGSRVDVTFETDAVTDQDFTYDVIYSSGVYPAVRVRFKAKLRMPVFALGSQADTTLLGDTITMYGRVINFYHLMHDDGTLVPNESIHIGTSTTLPAHVFYVLAGNGGNVVQMQGWLTDPSIVADTFDIDATINNTENALGFTVIMHDSAGVYGTRLLGEWTRRGYYAWSPEEPHETERLRYDANGTATVLYTTAHYWDGSEETDYTPRSFNWRIRVELVDGRPAHYVEHYGSGWATRFPLTYPVESFASDDAAYGQTRSVFTRQ